MCSKTYTTVIYITVQVFKYLKQNLTLSPWLEFSSARILQSGAGIIWEIFEVYFLLCLACWDQSMNGKSIYIFWNHSLTCSWKPNCDWFFRHQKMVMYQTVIKEGGKCWIKDKPTITFRNGQLHYHKNSLIFIIYKYPSTIWDKTLASNACALAHYSNSGDLAPHI